MNKIRTLTQLHDFLNSEFLWRLREIDDLKSSVRSSSSLRRNTLIRAGIPLLYAHWEGFVKNSSLGYINFVNSRRLRYEDIASCFIVFGLKRKLSQLSSSGQSRFNTEIIDFLLEGLSEKAVLQLGNTVDTESDLSSSVFENIALSVGIDPAPFEARYHLMDESLLKRRNIIAHGEYIDLTPDDYRKLADEVIMLMRNYKTEIENAAVLKKYLR
ncbi:MAE_28990/MAE_18760 family HEPN-like nuclease [Desulfobacterales bacterium HSG2]|nr:MAE_28990/MAE_18760 family HEPN-like nuclease [Desulfobacterales bacterium HSG2]